MFRPDTLALTTLLAGLTSLGPLSTDMYLPSLPAIAGYFGRDVAAVQFTLSAFLFGFAAGQILYGPLADRHGRKPVLLAGLALYLVATLVCAAAPSLEVLTVARFAQAFGASGPIVLARSIVRDVYAVDRASRELARMGTLMGLVPMIAPVLGGVLEVAFGWRASFVLAAAFGAVLAALVVFRLPETLRQRAAVPVSLGSIFATYRDLARGAGYRGYLMICACTYGGLFAFISASSFVLQGVYGLGPQAYGFCFAISVAGYIGGTLIAQRIVARRGLEGTMRAGVPLLLVGGIGVLTGTLFGPGHVAEVLAPNVLFMVGVGLVFPQSQAGAMASNPLRAGAASSLVGLSQMTFAAVTGSLLAHGLGGAAWPLGLAMALLGAAAVVVEVTTRGGRAASLAAARAADQR